MQNLQERQRVKWCRQTANAHKVHFRRQAWADASQGDGATYLDMSCRPEIFLLLTHRQNLSKPGAYQRKRRGSRETERQTDYASNFRFARDTLLKLHKNDTHQHTLWHSFSASLWFLVHMILNHTKNKKKRMFQNREVAFTIFKISINNKEIVNDMVHLLQHTPEICLPLPSFARLFYFWVQLETNGGVGQIAWTSWSSVEWPTFFRNFFYLFVLLHSLWIFC